MDPDPAAGASDVGAPETWVSALKRKAAASVWWVRVALVVFVAVCVWLLVTWALRDFWRFAIYAVAVVALFGISVLRAFHTGIGPWIDKAMYSYWLATAWFAAAVVPVLVARLLSDAVAAAPPVVAVVLLAFWLVLFGIGAGSLATGSGRKRVWNSLCSFGVKAPFVYALALATLAITLFATLAFVLSDHQMIRFDGDDTAAVVTEPADALDFFTWHMIDSIPALDITTTMRWEPRLEYRDGRVGLLVLVFKVAAITPIIAGFTSFWAFRRQRASAGSPAMRQATRLPAIPTRQVSGERRNDTARTGVVGVAHQQGGAPRPP